jgi:hypothetical protein
MMPQQRGDEMASGRTKRTKARDKKFFESLAATDNVTLSALAAGYARTSVYEHRESDPEFARQMDEAIEIATDALEEEARRRAKDGVDEPQFYQGALVVDKKKKPICVRRYSDRLMELLLKAHRPDKFRERVSQEISGPGGRPIEFESVVETARQKLRRLLDREKKTTETPKENDAG